MRETDGEGEDIVRFARVLIAGLLGATLLILPAQPASAHYNCNITAGHDSVVDPYYGLLWDAWAKMTCDHTHYLYLGQVKLQAKPPGGSWATLSDSGDKSLCCNNYSATFYAPYQVVQCFYSGTGKWRAFVPYFETESTTGNFAHQVTKFENVWTLTC